MPAALRCAIIIGIAAVNTSNSTIKIPLVVTARIAVAALYLAVGAQMAGQLDFLNTGRGVLIEHIHL